MKKTPRKKLKDDLDEICRVYIRLRDRMICQMCGKNVQKSNAHCSHVVPRSRGNALRWDEMNLKLLCFHCHINIWHKDPLRSGEWFMKKFPERIDYLSERYFVTKKFSIPELQEMLEEYEDKVLDMKVGRDITNNG